MVQRLPWLVDAAVVLAAGFFLAALFQGPARPAASSVPVEALPAASKPHIDPAAIAAVPLFGEEEKAPAQVEEPVSAAPTTLTLKLAGSVSGGKRPMAIVERPGKGQALYYVGDTLQPGVTLKEIHEREIIVRHGGKLERIAIDVPDLSSSAPEMMTAPAAHPIRQANAAPRAAVRVATQPLRLMPHFSGGKPDGLMIGQLASESRYARAGLRSGDIIRKVNGEAITSPRQAAQLRAALTGSKAEVEIVRNGQVRIIRAGKL